MSKNLNITGRDVVLRNMQKAIHDLKKGTERGVVAAGLHIVRKTSPLVPVDTGNLRSSVYLVSNTAMNNLPIPAFSNARKDAAKQARNRANALSDARARVNSAGGMPMVEVGYATTYAAAVHEHTAVPHSVGQAKYLETAVKSSASDIVKIIAQKARVR